jgi:hypothetical protein
MKRRAVRESKELVRDRGKMRPVMVSLHPDGCVSVKLKGLHGVGELIDPRTLYDVAMKIKARGVL